MLQHAWLWAWVPLVDTFASVWAIKAQLLCWPLYNQLVLHERWIWEIHYMQVRSSQALVVRDLITISYSIAGFRWLGQRRIYVCTGKKWVYFHDYKLLQIVISYFNNHNFGQNRHLCLPWNKPKIRINISSSCQHWFHNQNITLNVVWIWNRGHIWPELQNNGSVKDLCPPKFFLKDFYHNDNILCDQLRTEILIIYTCCNTFCCLQLISLKTPIRPITFIQFVTSQFKGWDKLISKEWTFICFKQ